MRLYLAGPMTGYPRWNFDAFTAAARALREAGYDVASPHEVDLANGFDPDAPVADFTREDYARVLLEDLRVIAQDVDGVALLPGWLDSNGARAEVALADALGKPVGTVSGYLEARR